jgi:putative transposase
MPTHVHLIVSLADADGLRATFAEAHRRDQCRFHWTVLARDVGAGHLFQGRFGAVVMDEPHLLAAVRYIALNPVAARLVQRAEEWPWSSARAHLAGADDELAAVAPLRSRIADFAAFLAGPADPAVTTRLERAPTICGPLGALAWVAMHERRLGRPLASPKPGPKPRAGTAAAPAQDDLPGIR